MSELPLLCNDWQHQQTTKHVCMCCARALGPGCRWVKKEGPLGVLHSVKRRQNSGVGCGAVEASIHRIHKWPPRGTVWTLAHENEVGKARVMCTWRATRRGKLLRRAVR